MVRSKAMEIIITIVVILLFSPFFVIVLHVVSRISETANYRRLAKTYSGELSALVAQADALRIAEMKVQLALMKNQGHKRLGVLQQAGGEPLNLCPRCGCSLRAALGNGALLYCTNQRSPYLLDRCTFRMDLPKKHELFSGLRIT